jgi:methylated-DNA-[protein]-cysteine S-methyltransferase
MSAIPESGAVFGFFRGMDNSRRTGVLSMPPRKLWGYAMKKVKKIENNTKNIFFYTFNKIVIGIAADENSIVGLDFGRAVPDGFTRAETPLIQKAAEQIEEYFAGKRKKFSLPIVMRGTEFQMDVWRALQSIPYGETRSYKDIAAQIGRPKAVRAVGMANHRNPISIIVPCHRVIGHNGSLTGYGGGLPLKQYLLELEQGIK